MPGGIYLLRQQSGSSPRFVALLTQSWPQFHEGDDHQHDQDEYRDLHHGVKGTPGRTRWLMAMDSTS